MNVVPEIVARDPDTMNVSVVYRILGLYSKTFVLRTPLGLLNHDLRNEVVLIARKM